jgi:O-antigen/teichoic acid export membrane protein
MNADRPNLFRFNNLIKSTFFKDFSFTAINRIVALFVPLIIIPLFLKKLGSADFGIWQIIQSFISYLGLINLGILQYAQNEIAASYAKRDSLSINKLIKSVEHLFIVICLTISFLLIIAAALTYFYSLSTNKSYIILFLVAGILFLWSFPPRIYSSALRAIQRISIEQNIGTFLLIIKYLAIILVLMIGGNLFPLVIVNGLLIIVPFILMREYFRRNSSIHEKVSGYWDKGLIKNALKPSIGFFVLQIAGLFVYSSSTIIIAAFINTTAVAKFSIAFQLIFFIIGFTNIITNVAGPKISSAYSANDFETLKYILFSMRRLLTLIGGVVFIALLMFGKTIIILWVGQANFIGENVFILFLVYFIIQMFLLSDDAIVVYTSNHQKYAIAGICEGIIFVASSIYLIQIIGITGVLFSFIISRILTNGWYLPLKSANILHLNSSRNFIFFFTYILIIILISGPLFLFFNDAPLLIKLIATIMGIIIFLSMHIFINRIQRIA